MKNAVVEALMCVRHTVPLTCAALPSHYLGRQGFPRASNGARCRETVFKRHHAWMQHPQTHAICACSTRIQAAALATTHSASTTASLSSCTQLMPFDQLTHRGNVSCAAWPGITSLATCLSLQQQEDVSAVPCYSQELSLIHSTKVGPYVPKYCRHSSARRVYTFKNCVHVTIRMADNHTLLRATCWSWVMRRTCRCYVHTALCCAMTQSHQPYKLATWHYGCMLIH
jgi:hypothetical protein